MEKPTSLMSDLPDAEKLERKMTQKSRDKYRAIRARKALHAKRPKVYYVKHNNGTVSGTKHLQDSALYPKRFCTAVVAIWASNYNNA